MHSRLALALSVCSLCVLAQTPDDPEIAHAKAEIGKLRALVEAGALPRTQLAKAEDQLADAQDAAILRRTLYGQDLTVDQSDEMLSAAERRLERRQKALEEARSLVSAGVASELSIGTFLEELDSARKERELAESRAHLTRDLSDMAKAELSVEARLSEDPDATSALQAFERFDGSGQFSTATFHKLEQAYAEQFGKALPVSALGETAVHRALGFDHRGRVDVAVNPDQPEGVWLRQYLIDHSIPFYAFRHAVAGKATGAHIHLGPGSTRLKLGG